MLRMHLTIQNLKVYGGSVLASFLNMAFLNEVAVFLQIVLTVVTIWYTVKKGRKK